MAEKLRIEISGAGARALMTSPEIVAALESCADRIMDRLPSGYEKSVYPKGKSRANVSVFADTATARRENAQNNTLLRAFGGAAK